MLWSMWCVCRVCSICIYVLVCGAHARSHVGMMRIHIPKAINYFYHRSLSPAIVKLTQLDTLRLCGCNITHIKSDQILPSMPISPPISPPSASSSTSSSYFSPPPKTRHSTAPDTISIQLYISTQWLKLTYLDLSRNNIKIVPSHLRCLKNLVRLILQFNKIESIEEGVLHVPHPHTQHTRMHAGTITCNTPHTGAYLDCLIGI
jgi:hypothetical protein